MGDTLAPFWTKDRREPNRFPADALSRCFSYAGMILASATSPPEVFEIVRLPVRIVTVPHTRSLLCFVYAWWGRIRKR